MRIIAGRFKKANLYSISGTRIRPTTDYTKEVIFNILHELEDKKVLDLYSGCGSLGLEALSRGAAHVTFIDFSEHAIGAMIKNFKKLNCSSECRIYRKRVSSFLKKTTKTFDIIFADPPYNKNLVNQTIDKILKNTILNPGGKIIVEHSPNELIQNLWDANISTRQLSRNTSLSFIS